MKRKTELLFGLFLLVLGLQGKSQNEVQTFNDGTKLQLPEPYNIAWMKNLPNDLLLSKITLPGTHDTMALYGGPAAECQVWKLEDQLKAGIRYLDLRVSAFGNKGLYIMHGIIYQYATFQDVLGTIKNFLTNYPSETVLVRVKPSLSFKDESVEKLVKNWLKTAHDYNIWAQPKMPTIAEARGKVVFVQKGSFKLGISLNETDSKGDYKVVNIKHKIGVIQKNLDKAIKQCGGQSAVLTYSSGTGIGTIRGMFLTPKRVAKNINPWFYNYLPNYTSKSVCFGIIAMDFPGIDLIQTIIGFNFVSTVST